MSFFRSLFAIRHSHHSLHRPFMAATAAASTMVAASDSTDNGGKEESKSIGPSSSSCRVLPGSQSLGWQQLCHRAAIISDSLVAFQQIKQERPLPYYDREVLEYDREAEYERKDRRQEYIAKLQRVVFASCARHYPTRTSDICSRYTDALTSATLRADDVIGEVIRDNDTFFSWNRQTKRYANRFQQCLARLQQAPIASQSTLAKQLDLCTSVDDSAYDD
jgi:hypothetical protein